MEYINFKGRNWSYAGDKGTWATFAASADGKKFLRVKKAQKGIISSAYAKEMNDFCAQHGVDFAAMRCGETVEVPIFVATL